MGMYSLIEDARSKALEAANCWAETPEATALLEKIDAYERCSDRWSALSDVAKAFADAAADVEDELDDLRRKAIYAAAATYNTERNSGEWLDAWDAAEEDAPPVAQVVREARRNHAGDGFLQALAA